MLVGGIFEKEINFFVELVWPPKLWFAASLGSVAGGWRATFYLDQSNLHCFLI